LAKVLRCIDMGPQCKWVGRAETEEELRKIAVEHASSVHGMKEIPKELWAKAKTLIRDEKR
jgi:predicted small metal-binding protein